MTFDWAVDVFFSRPNLKIKNEKQSTWKFQELGQNIPQVYKRIVIQTIFEFSLFDT